MLDPCPSLSSASSRRLVSADARRPAPLPLLLLLLDPTRSKQPVVTAAATYVHRFYMRETLQDWDPKVRTASLRPFSSSSCTAPTDLSSLARAGHRRRRHLPREQSRGGAPLAQDAPQLGPRPGRARRPAPLERGPPEGSSARGGPPARPVLRPHRQAPALDRRLGRQEVVDRRRG